MKQPLLSIVTVTKNCAASVGKTLHSVSQIKNEHVEYIIIDGASTDGTVELIRSSGKLVDKFLSESDDGIYNAMNKGLDLAIGKYILFINGDDELVPDGFAAIWPLLTCTDDKVIIAKTKVLGVEGPLPDLVASKWKLLFFNSIPHPSSFVLTALLRRYRFREDLRIASDYDLFLRLFLDGYKFITVNTITALHCRGGVSANSALSIDEMNQIRLNRFGKIRYQLLNIVWKIYRMIKYFSFN